MENKISLIIPSHNEEKTIAQVINLFKNHPLVGEIIVVNNSSTDNTVELATKAGATVVDCVPQGKGYAMEKGIASATNELIVFLDGDIIQYDTDIIQVLSVPLIENRADFVKSNFSREGGRVTELVAKPLLELVFPDIHQFNQPLSGAIAGKKSLFNKIVFEKDYGVDVGILLDVISLNVKIEEVYIGSLENRSQDWKSLIKMSTEVQKAILKRANKPFKI